MKSNVKTIYSIKKTDKETLLKWYHLLFLGRTLDERAPNYLKQAIGWSYHAPAAGHDGIQLAIGQVFRKNKDHLFPYYRDLQTCVSAGLTAEEVIYNGISKDADVAGGGRHMSNHFAKPAWNIHNSSSCTGNHTLHATGMGRALKTYKEKDAVVISSQGESSVSEGYVYEAINGASNEQLPVVFVFQDNGYGISVPKEDQTANRKVARNFEGFKHLRIIYCNGKDVFDSMNAMTEAVEWAKKEQKPVIVHANCVRIGSHSNSDRHELYRDENELSYVKEYDPLAKYRRLLLRYERATEEELKEIEDAVAAEVKDAHKKGLAAPHPTPESVHDFVIGEAYPASKYPEGVHEHNGEPIKLITALNETLKAEFRNNPDTYLWGQDIANKDKGGIFNVSKGMQQEFGKTRVFNAPIAEDFIMGTANGMSRYKKEMRVVVEGAEFADYFWPAMEQFVETTHEYWRTKGQYSPNITVRLASGGYIGGGLYHSQTIEGALTTFPGVRVVYPSFADDAAGLLRTAIRSEGMTVFMEPKALYNAPKAATPVPDDFEVPFGKARIRREGKDLTIFTYGNTTHFCLEAAEKLSKEGFGEVEVVDLRSLLPLDEETIINSVKKTSKALIVHEDKVFAGFGGEVAATISDLAFHYLDAPIKRVGSTFTPVGFNRTLEAAILPNTDKVIKAVKELLEF
ncbi:alpha-ketoacid dehydrogenase subunit alpha/beta [Alkalitalea saponilacus]|uniref:3-methyl-2-oxobutanoate dehydrogenase (2-methylpropanoyl-transferring) n=1 Tax=Alkalitalea saponilacus TaxID=889453 RepID=A0A1T5DC78_9BACT|nr:alpha-ketoacid dehydrogenase subunit alpha/beta [Alkalitalea saponilacus]ASB50654.1 2-oxoisovalerate dehydrogenase [Alkalitalea saponilacus]SKB69123.1 2-oxoisovalerate dehydrogenase E1 component [Alkalitalea saponilacus]